jgi:hypothetical protein
MLKMRREIRGLCFAAGIQIFREFVGPKARRCVGERCDESLTWKMIELNLSTDRKTVDRRKEGEGGELPAMLHALRPAALDFSSSTVCNNRGKKDKCYSVGP